MDTKAKKTQIDKKISKQKERFILVEIKKAMIPL